MWIKILKILVLYSGLLLLALLSNITVCVFFVEIFGGNSNLLQIPLTLLFTYIAGYKGVKALSKVDGVNKVLGSPFWQGASIPVFAGLLGALIYYVFTKEILIGQGLAIILIGGFGGRRAATNSRKKSSIA